MDLSVACDAIGASTLPGKFDEDNVGGDAVVFFRALFLS